MAAASMSALLVEFPEHDSELRVSRQTIQALAQRFDMSETEVVHLALARLAHEEQPTYAADDGPLTDDDIEELRKAARSALPAGALLRRSTLL